MLFQGASATPNFLRAFWHDAAYLFAGSAFIAFGLVAAALAALRRKFDPLLIYFALFASLYGFRMWVQSDILQIAWGNSGLFWRLSSALDYLMLVPAVLFFNAAEITRQRARIVGYLLALTGIVLAIAALATGPARTYHLVNNTAVILATLFLIADFGFYRERDDDFLVVRRGFMSFAVLIVFDNVSGALALPLPRFEPLGFAALLVSLGIVTARRIFKRDQQLLAIQNELEVARRIQLSILPEKFPASQCFQVEARYVPLSSVAGDFYDYVVAEESCAALLIADVSGHGVPAALIASMVKVVAGSQRENASEPAKFLTGMNAALCGNTQGQFVTAALVWLDGASRELRYAAAGHPPMLLLRDGKVSEVMENGLILGIFDYAGYAEARFTLQKGDRLLLYTDGIVEAADREGEFFGRERLGSLLAETARLSASDVADRVVAAVKTWAFSQEDDLTLIVCDYLHP